MELIKSLLSYRDFILGSVKREFLLKYKKSILGSFWAIINPLAMILIYTIIFSKIMHAKLPGISSGFAYSIYLCSGLLTWGLFAEITGKMLNIFLDNANLLKKISFPRLTLPCIVICNAMVNFVIIFSLFLIFVLFNGFWPGLAIFEIIPVLIIQIIFSVGIGILLAVANVFLRDVGQFFGIFLQFWFWFTPIVYPVSILPSKIITFMYLNPMLPIITSYQNIFVFNTSPSWISLLYPLLLGVLICILGFYSYKNHIDEILDEI